MYILRKIFKQVLELNNWILFGTTFALVVFSSYFMYWLEPENYGSVYNGLWWTLTTMTTVGYGDFYPESVAGKAFGMFIFLSGIGLIGAVIGKIVDAMTIYRKKREEGKLKYKGKNHVVIIGWTTKARFAVEEILATNEHTEIVVVDNIETLDVRDRLHYIKGYATEEYTLEQANVKESEAILIFADDRLNDDSNADGKTLMIATSVEKYADVYTIAEVRDERHVSNFRHAKVDEFILTHELISHLAVRSIFSKGVSKIFTQLTSHDRGLDLFEVPARKEWKTYRDAFNGFLELGATLLADNHDLNINRRLDEVIPDSAYFQVICDKSTYQKLIS